MKDKHNLFSLALFSAIVLVAVMSILHPNELYGDIAQSLTVPLLVLSFVSVAASIPAHIINTCKRNIAWFERMRQDTTMLYKYASIHVDLYSADDEYKSSLNTTKVRYKCDIDKICDDIHVANGVISKFKMLGILFDILYTISLCLLILCGFVSSLVAQCFHFVSLPVFTFISIIIFLFRVLYSEKCADNIGRKMGNSIRIRMKDIVAENDEDI